MEMRRGGSNERVFQSGDPAAVGVVLSNMTVAFDHWLLGVEGYNVVLISNHQTEADPIIISLLLEKANPHIAENMLYSLGEKTIVSISAGKYWAATATATAIRDVYM
ncbi:hypothetical protein GOBAR_DD21241 [Gossypium barbadense]|nr:hypothetical protein GOBAR_DD21241 [Gossypium barbadense]